MNPGPLFSFLFFFMLVLLAISSVCGGWEALVGSIMDEFPQLRTRRVLVMVVSCAVAFLIGFRNFPHPASIEDMPNYEIIYFVVGHILDWCGMWALNSRIAICFHSGFLLFQLMDLRTASAVLVMAFLELSLMGWLYGAGPFMKHIKVSLRYIYVPTMYKKLHILEFKLIKEHCTLSKIQNI